MKTACMCQHDAVGDDDDDDDGDEDDDEDEEDEDGQNTRREVKLASLFIASCSDMAQRSVSMPY